MFGAEVFGRRKRRSREPVLGTRAFDLLCLTMAAVLALHAPHLPWWFTSVLAAGLVARWWQRRRRGARLPWWGRLPLTLLLPVVVFTTYGTVFGQQPGSALAVGLLVLKTLESEHPRDARTGAAFACFALMAALLISQSLVRTMLVLLALLPPLACLKALEPVPTRPRLWREFMPILKMLGLAIPLALAMFVLVPRLSSPLWGAARDAGAATTGVSQRMAPGDFTQLLVDDSVAFRVHFAGKVPPPDERYFRGPVLWAFDGRTWTTGQPDPSRGRRKHSEQLTDTGDSYRYRVTMKPTHQRWLYTLDTPVRVPNDAHINAERAVRRDESVNEVIQFSAKSVTQHTLEPDLSDADRRRGLQLPVGYDARATALARHWRKKYGADSSAIVQQALAMFRHKDFHYTLAPDKLGRDSIDDFLFSTREGFCEHYASSFTFLMRAAGIPARVVTGYQGGYWNKTADYLLVRQSDAHAWSEVWLDHRGWVRVDPTAAVSPDRVDIGAGSAAGDSGAWYQQGWIRALGNQWDQVNRLWDQAIVKFDVMRQHGMLSDFGIRRVNTTVLLLALTASLVLAMVIGVLVVMRPARRNRDRAAAAMALLRRRLARAGVTYKPSEGPAEYFQRAQRILPHEKPQLHILKQQWMQLRYAQEQPEAAVERAFERAVHGYRPRRARRQRRSAVR